MVAEAVANVVASKILDMVKIFWLLGHVLDYPKRECQLFQDLEKKNGQQSSTSSRLPGDVVAKKSFPEVLPQAYTTIFLKTFRC